MCKVDIKTELYIQTNKLLNNCMHAEKNRPDSVIIQ